MTLITTASDHVMNYKDWSYRNMRKDNTVNGFSRLFIFLRRHLTQVMHATVNIGVLAGIVVLDSVYHLPRFLRCRPIVEINQRPTIYLPGQNRKVLSHLFNVEFPGWHICVLSQKVYWGGKASTAT